MTPHASTHRQLPVAEGTSPGARDRADSALTARSTRAAPTRRRRSPSAATAAAAAAPHRRRRRGADARRDARAARARARPATSATDIAMAFVAAAGPPRCCSRSRRAPRSAIAVTAPQLSDDAVQAVTMPARDAVDRPGRARRAQARHRAAAEGAARSRIASSRLLGLPDRAGRRADRSSGSAIACVLVVGDPRDRDAATRLARSRRARRRARRRPTRGSCATPSARSPRIAVRVEPWPRR